MRKLISVFFILIISFSALTGCGVKRPLYQAPEHQKLKNAERNQQQPQPKQEK